LKSGNLNFLEPSGPVQACNGIALLLQEMTGRGKIYIGWGILKFRRLKVGAEKGM